VKFGVYNAIVHDRPLSEALKVVKGLDLDGLEVNTGGFLPPVHIPNIDEVLESDAARDDFLGMFEAEGLEVLGLNCNGNPLHPNPVIGDAHSADVVRSVKLAHRLGQHRVITMSGLPGGEPGTKRPNWIVNAWTSGSLDVLNYQWDVAARFWSGVDALARDLDVTVALELHPQNLVFNPASMLELRDRIGATNLGVELDASHLFWQQMDPVAVVDFLGDVVAHAAAKDVRVNEHAAINGVLDNSFRRLDPTEQRVNLGGDEWANEWPKPSAWDFVAVGKGHDVEFWAEFLRALDRVDPNMIVNIEHEDTSFGPIEGLEYASGVLLEAARKAGVRE
jgi:sugar phosphate isomerase/epimerase